MLCLFVHLHVWGGRKSRNSTLAWGAFVLSDWPSRNASRMAHGSSLLLGDILGPIMFAKYFSYTITKNVIHVGCLHTATWDRSCPNRHPQVDRLVRVDAATQPVRWASETSSPTRGHGNGSAHPAAGATMCPPVFCFQTQTPTSVFRWFLSLQMVLRMDIVPKNHLLNISMHGVPFPNSTQ